MNKPDILTRLDEKKIPIHHNYPKLEETWNYICDFVENLQGDGDVNNGNGLITVINKETGHPLIKMKGTNISTSGGGGIGESNLDDPWVISPVDRAISRAVYTIGTKQVIDGNITTAKVGSNYLTFTFSEYDSSDPIPSASAELTSTDQTNGNKVSILIAIVSGDAGSYTIEYYNRFPQVPVWEVF